MPKRRLLERQCQALSSGAGQERGKQWSQAEAGEVLAGTKAIFLLQRLFSTRRGSLPRGAGVSVLKF